MSGDLSTQFWLRLKDGESAAAEQLFQLCMPYLKAVARRKLSDRLRSECDSNDIVQSVWVGLLRQLERQGWQIQNIEQLRGLLATMAQRRVIDGCRRQARSIVSSQSVVEPTFLSEPKKDSPSQMAQADDLWNRMLRLCPPEHHNVLLCRRDGLLIAEIAARTGLHEGSVRRILRKLSRDLALENDPLPSDKSAHQEG